MTLTTLLIRIAIVALILTLAIGFWKKGHKSWVLTFLQNFTGVLFVFSGLVKAVDPMGTAFKMEQYFAEFEYTFQETAMSFLAPLFPMLSNIAIVFSVTMIVLEIVVGLMLILGHKAKLTSWLFLIIVAFFTFLTGFTYLTGYVPEGVNFFQFGQWGPYTASNMKVTDCGCFGDYIKLEPKTSFFKDIFLLIPAILFVFKHKDMHELFSKKVRWALVGITTVGLIIYCMSNYVWDIPRIDFRPFKEGANIAEVKAAEEEAAANVKIVAYKMRNKADGKVVEIPYATYMKEYKSYPKEEWDILEQVKTEPAIIATKVSEFDFADEDGNHYVEELLTDTEPSFMIVAYKLKGEARKAQQMVRDTTWVRDTVRQGDDLSKEIITRSIGSIDERSETVEVYDWSPGYLKNWSEKVTPFIAAAKADGRKVFAVVGGAGHYKIESFRKAVQLDIPFYEADDILLKTIIRSNPGVMLWDDGIILDKWHENKLPEYDKVKAQYFN